MSPPRGGNKAGTNLVREGVYCAADAVSFAWQILTHLILAWHYETGAFTIPVLQRGKVRPRV